MPPTSFSRDKRAVGVRHTRGGKGWHPGRSARGQRKVISRRGAYNSPQLLHGKLRRSVRYGSAGNSCFGLALERHVFEAHSERTNSRDNTRASEQPSYNTAHKPRCHVLICLDHRLLKVAGVSLLLHPTTRKSFWGRRTCDATPLTGMSYRSVDSKEGKKSESHWGGTLS